MDEQEYSNCEFCIITDCCFVDKVNKKCKVEGCVRSAKEFHGWLTANDYKIVKEKKDAILKIRKYGDI